MTNPVSDNLMQIAHPSSHSHALTLAKTQRCKDDDGGIVPAERRPATSLINLFVAARNTLIEGRQRRRTYDALMAFDDRSLTDIGMHRSQLMVIIEAMYQRGVTSGRLACAPRALRSSKSRMANHIGQSRYDRQQAGVDHI